MPERWPTLDSGALKRFSTMAYADVAVELMWPFVEGDIDRGDFEAMVVDAYASFDHPDQAATLPVKVLEAAVSSQGADCRRELPHLWTLGFGIRARI